MHLKFDHLPFILAFQGVSQRHSHVDTHIVQSFPGVTDSTAWRPVIWNMADSDSSEKSIYYHLFLNFPPPLRWPSPCSDTSDAYSASLDIDLDTADAILLTEFVNTQPENRDGAQLPAQTTKFVVAVLDRLATSDLEIGLVRLTWQLSVDWAWPKSPTVTPKSSGDNSSRHRLSSLFPVECHRNTVDHRPCLGNHSLPC